MFVNWPVGSDSSKSNVPSGSCAKASSVGANTVNGPSPDKVSFKPEALRAVFKVEWFSE